MGEAVGTATGVLTTTPVVEAPDDKELDFVPTETENLLAIAENHHCLAKNFGCFACIERCETEAIKLVMGQGIRIDEALCTGCGACRNVCPVTPKAIKMRERS